MKVNQNIRSVAVNFLKGEFRVPRPQIESPAQLEANAARVETTRLLGSQAVTRRKGKKERRIVTRIRRKIDRRRTAFVRSLYRPSSRDAFDPITTPANRRKCFRRENDEKEDDSIVVEARWSFRKLAKLFPSGKESNKGRGSEPLLHRRNAEISRNYWNYVPLCGKSGTERVERSFRLGVDKSGKVFSNCKLDKSREFLKSIKFESSKRR